MVLLVLLVVLCDLARRMALIEVVGVPLMKLDSVQWKCGMMKVGGCKLRLGLLQLRIVLRW